MSLDAVPSAAPRRGVTRSLVVATFVAAAAVVVAVATRSNQRVNLGDLQVRTRADAIIWDTTALQSAAVPPGTTWGRHPRIKTYQNSFTAFGERNWTAAGSVSQALAFVRANPPAGLVLEAAESGALYYAEGGGARSLAYSVSAQEGGVKVKVLASAAWRSMRPAWSYAPGHLGSVDVAVVRKPVSHRVSGAPTVRRRLTGAVAGRLVALFNSLPAEPLVTGASCPTQAVQTSDTLVIHTEQRMLTVVDAESECTGQASITEAGRVGMVYIDGSFLDDGTLDAVGLPVGYGVD